MIVIEPLEPSVAMITRGGVVIVAYKATQTKLAAQAQPQVRPIAQKKSPLYVQKPKRIFIDRRPEVVRMKHLSTSCQVRDMPERLQNIFEQQTASKSADKVSKLKPFMSSCLAR